MGPLSYILPNPHLKKKKNHLFPSLKMCVLLIPTVSKLVYVSTVCQLVAPLELHSKLKYRFIR